MTSSARNRDIEQFQLVTSEATKRFRYALLRHRHSLRYKESVVEFDTAWHLSMAPAVNSINERARHQYFFRGGAEMLMNKELEVALQLAKKHYITIRKLAPSLRGAELLRTFVLDLVGPKSNAAKVLRNSFMQTQTRVP